ncbi:uncharacterized protein TRIADDRAFT_61354 [Trichoplax adhaerens]|uniref:Major facilitator superfamily (MFS) profile domain-containing protein n=1 Tax=Trichoplax adhaerens TaxID=10228 RepID=B3SAR6_TRIAD|nr:hypothetical protein TRIADDRAFT_61354 [Trichoplax adhaerens]EDV20147.1 hypothetical protein TRIADDRAFT_61354 [Trichoplax adhaerens]|eukprot:XP_002117308.1 hypothetical protein TRIADDRAFT_61354 [Trichoplax adhaerens]
MTVEDNSNQPIIEEKILLEKRRVPKDRFHLVYILFFILGNASSLPIHIFMTAEAYYSVKLKGTPYQYNFENYIIVAYSISTIFASAANLRLLKSINVKHRMIFGLIVLTISFIFTAFMSKLDTTNWKITFFALTIITVILTGLFGNSMYQSSLYGLVGVFPKNYSQAVQCGQALSAILTALASIISLIVGKSVYDSGLGYFSSGVVLLMLCMCIQFLLGRVEFAKYYMRNLECGKKTVEKITLIEEDGEEMDEEIKPMYNRKLSNYQRINYVFKETWPTTVALFTCYTVTYTVYPAICSRVASVDRGDNDLFTGKLYIPITTFLLFATADMVGRTISVWVLWPSAKRGITLMILSLGRIIFIPLIFYCNAQPRRKSIPVLIPNDAAYVLIITLFALSHGYIKAIGVMHAPMRVNSSYRESAGSMSYFAIVSGFGIGSALSFLVAAVLY